MVQFDWLLYKKHDIVTTLRTATLLSRTSWILKQVKELILNFVVFLGYYVTPLLALPEHRKSWLFHRGNSCYAGKWVLQARLKPTLFRGDKMVKSETQQDSETLVCKPETETKTCKTLHWNKCSINETLCKGCQDFEIGWKICECQDFEGSTICHPYLWFIILGFHHWITGDLPELCSKARFVEHNVMSSALPLLIA